MQRKPIRAILGRFSYEYSKKAVEKVLLNHSFDFCGIISTGAEPEYFEGMDQQNQEWFVSSDIRGCHYEGVDFTILIPLDEKLIEGMRECETMFYDMVYRIEWKRSISFAERKRLYYRHLRFWNDFILTRKINLYFSAWMPHEIPDLVIYYLCKYYNIPVLYFEAAAMVKDTSFAERSIEDSAKEVGLRFEELQKTFADITDPEQIPLGKRFDERYHALAKPEGQRPPAEVTLPTYLQKVFQLLKEAPGTFFRCAALFVTFSGIQRVANALERRKVFRQRNAFYDEHAIEPDLEKAFIYFPLHFQPEASTNPMGGVYADQVLVAQLLASKLPEGVLLYIKEHPWESGWLLRDVEYYETLLDIPNVRLVARNVSTFTLREKCKATAVVTGTAGFESIFFGRPVFLFGHRFYQYMKGVFPIHSVEDCESAVKEVFEDGVCPTLKDCRLYLKAMEETCVDGTLNPWHYRVTDLPEETHVNTHADAMLKEIEAVL